MLLHNANKNSQGFTMVETIIVLMIVGILSAISAPSFLALFRKNQVNNALSQVRGALQEAQREAISRSKKCVVTLDKTNNKVTSSCFATGDRTLADGVAMATNVKPNTSISGNPIQITFGIRGNTTFTVASSSASPNDSSGKIILYKSDSSTSSKQCVAISSGIGIIRAGNYSGSINSDNNITDSGTCTASQ